MLKVTIHNEDIQKSYNTCKEIDKNAIAKGGFIYHSQNKTSRVDKNKQVNRQKHHTQHGGLHGCIAKLAP